MQLASLMSGVVTVRENLHAYAEVARVEAFDADDAHNGLVRYSLRSVSPIHSPGASAS